MARAIAVTLPVLLAVVVAVIAITARVRAAGPDTSPLPVVPVDAPQAGDARCTDLLAGLDGDLPAGDATLPVRPLAAPSPAGVRAWAALPDPVVLRCGLSRPSELTPTSSLLVIDGVQWLRIGADEARPATFVTVDRPVYVALTVPVGVGSGPVQAVSDVVRARMPAVPVAVSP